MLGGVMSGHSGSRIEGEGGGWELVSSDEQCSRGLAVLSDGM